MSGPWFRSLGGVALGCSVALGGCADAGPMPIADAGSSQGSAATTGTTMVTGTTGGRGTDGVATSTTEVTTTATAGVTGDPTGPDPTTGNASNPGGTTSAGDTADTDGDTDTGGEVAFAISSPDFDDLEGCGPDAPDDDLCGLFDVDNTRFGADVSPQIDWTPGPAGTQSYALAFHDLSNDVGNGDVFTHWIVWNIPASTTMLPASLPAGTMPGVPDATTQQVSFEGDNGFTGSGACGNVYEFVLFALSEASFAPNNPNSADAVQSEVEASGLVLETATMRGRSNPDGPCGG